MCRCYLLRQRGGHRWGVLPGWGRKRFDARAAGRFRRDIRAKRTDGRLSPAAATRLHSCQHEEDRCGTVPLCCRCGCGAGGGGSGSSHPAGASHADLRGGRHGRWVCACSGARAAVRAQRCACCGAASALSCARSVVATSDAARLPWLTVRPLQWTAGCRTFGATKGFGALTHRCATWASALWTWPTRRGLRMIPSWHGASLLRR